MVNIKYFILVLIWLLINPFLLAGKEKIYKEGGRYVTKIERQFDVALKGTFSILRMAGSLQIKSWGKNVVFISEKRQMNVSNEKEAENILKNVDSEYSATKNSVVIEIQDLDEDIYSTFNIKVPKWYALELKTAGGDIDIEGIIGAVKAKTSGGDIEIEDIEGNVNIATSGGNIEVKQIKGDIAVRTSGGEIDIDNVTGDTFAKTSGGEIKIYNTVGDIEAETNGGSIYVINNQGVMKVETSGGEIKLENVGIVETAYTSGGNINMEKSTGDVTLITSGGDINFDQIKGKAIVKTSGGDIEGSDVENGIEAITSGGDIEIDGIKGPTNAITSGGDVSVEIITSNYNLQDKIDLKSSGGDIKLKIPKLMPADIKALIKLKNFPWKNYKIISDFPELSGDHIIKSKKSIITSGKINGGGIQIDLTTSNGDIEIEN